MRSTEIIRSILDLIDHIDLEQQSKEPSAAAVFTPEQPLDDCGGDPNRFRQIVDLLTSEYGQMYDNSPAEVIAGIESVTTHAGGGWNGPKNPADIRADSVSMYPNYQHKPGV